MPSALTLALIEHLVRRGVIDADDIDAMSSRLDAEGETDDAHACRVAFIEAQAPSQSEWEAQRRRARFEVVPDGGNKPS